MKTNFGFTLIELMIVVAILGILAAVAIPKFANMHRKSKEAAVKGNLTILRSAIKLYFSDASGYYPVDNLNCLTVDAKYLDKIPDINVTEYHKPNNIVETNDDWGTTDIFTVDNGRWLYWNDSNNTSIEKNWGSIWVGCTHTDVINNYISNW